MESHRRAQKCSATGPRMREGMRDMRGFIAAHRGSRLRQRLLAISFRSHLHTAGATCRRMLSRNARSARGAVVLLPLLLLLLLLTVLSATARKRPT